MESRRPSTPPTALLCSTEPSLVSLLSPAFTGSDLALEWCSEPATLLTRVPVDAPELVLLTAEPASAPLMDPLDRAGVPVVALVDGGSVIQVLSWLQRGASDVCAPGHFTAEVLERARTPRGDLAERMLCWARRERLTGEFRALTETPLEGVAVFRDGLLRHAHHCGLDSEAALQAMLELSADELSFVPAAASQRPAREYAPKVLVAEDDDALRTMLCRQIERAGYRVFAARDGLEAFTLTQRERIDAVVSDLEMPRLDGWGLLRALSDDPGLHELPLILLSAHDDTIDTLKAAHAGARAYLKKTGHSQELLVALSLLTAPRRQAWTALAANHEATVELPALGAAWLLETLAELDLRGRLELEDGPARYEVTLAEGHLLGVVAQIGSLHLEGTLALEALLASRSRGRFVFAEARPPADAPWLFEQLAEVKRNLSLSAAERIDDAVLAPRRLRLDDRLAGLYGRVASPRELKVLDGLRQQPTTLEELAALAATPPHDVSRIVTDFLRRGVVTTER